MVQPPSMNLIGSIIGQIGRPSFPAALDRMLADLAPFDLSAVFGFPFDAKPLLLYDGYREHSGPAQLEAYLNGAYLLDPFYTACVRGCEPGLWRMRDLAPDKYFDSEFFHSAEVHPCVSLLPGSLVEEIGYLVPLEDGFYAAYSLMRSQGEPFSSDEMSRLTELEPFVRNAIRTHWRNLRAPGRRFNLGDLMETAFASFCDDKLTYQQKKIVQLILRGHSNFSIGQHISVTEGTVRMHRQNIYKRLKISSQRELFELFMRNFLAQTGTNA